jgi:glutamate synthase (NADPH/NADH) large chain
VTLISPPPHHDIYSIEDLAQLIFDLKCVNPRARVSVKLVSETASAPIAAGVAKAHADAIHIAGHDGGTGASPLSSISTRARRGSSGLARDAPGARAQRSARARAPPGRRAAQDRGRDVAFAALLGADEFGFATAPLVASGCVMMRKCHLNTCPVGVATQDPVLRARFAGTPGARHQLLLLRRRRAARIMARLGFRTLDEMVGRTDRITSARSTTPRPHTLDFTDVL